VAAPLYLVRQRRCWWQTPGEITAPFRAAFTGRPDAERCARRLGRDHARSARPRVNPFWGDWVNEDWLRAYPGRAPGLGDVTSLPGVILHDWMREAGFDGRYAPPAGKTAEYLAAWANWWHTVLEGRTRWDQKSRSRVFRLPPFPLTDAPLARFWEAIDRYPFFEVVEVGPPGEDLP
jgi:hypothetical protein